MDSVRTFKSIARAKLTILIKNPNFEYILFVMQYANQRDYGSWSVGNITDEMLSKYLDHHNDHPNSNENFILE